IVDGFNFNLFLSILVAGPFDPCCMFLYPTRDKIYVLMEIGVEIMPHENIYDQELYLSLSQDWHFDQSGRKLIVVKMILYDNVTCLKIEKIPKGLSLSSDAPEYPT
ncbi:hypothetical protein ACJX0J_031108, partial [Zea mays]